MSELLQNAESIITYVVLALFGGTTIGNIVLSVAKGKMERRALCKDVLINRKDVQIEELKGEIGELKECVSLMASSQFATQLAMKTLSPSVKQHVAESITKIQKISGIKLDSVVKDAVKALTDNTSFQVSEEKRIAIEKKAQDTQKILDSVNESASDIMNKIRI